MKFLKYLTQSRVAINLILLLSIVTAVFGFLNAKDISEQQISVSLLLLNAAIVVLTSESYFIDELNRIYDGQKNITSHTQ